MKKLSKTKDPFFTLKYIALCRTGLPINEEDLDDEAMVNFARWQVCKVRNVLWNDPIWDEYTSHEILIEYFAIKFDENADLRKEFEANLISVKEDDLDWFERMAREYGEGAKDSKTEGEAKEPEPPKAPEEFEDTF